MDHASCGGRRVSLGHGLYSQFGNASVVCTTVDAADVALLSQCRTVRIATRHQYLNKDKRRTYILVQRIEEMETVMEQTTENRRNGKRAFQYERFNMRWICETLVSSFLFSCV